MLRPPVKRCSLIFPGICFADYSTSSSHSAIHSLYASGFCSRTFFTVLCYMLYLHLTSV